MSSYTHLHVHSDYSLLDASISVPQLVAEAKRKGMKALALTDHGNVHGLVQFYTECKKQGIKPILGCEVYVARKSALSKMDRDGGNPTDHLILLARNKTGYENILKLVSWAFQKGFHYAARVDVERLAEHSEGIIALTACLSGGVNRLLRGWEHGSLEKKTYREYAPDFQAAAALAKNMQDIFGKDGFFLEVQRHAGQYENPELLAKQERLICESERLAKHAGIPMIPTNDIHFCGPEDAAAREMAFLIARGKVETGGMDSVAHAAEYYVKSPDEMAAAFAGNPMREYLFNNTLWVAEQCNVELELDKHHFAPPIDAQGPMSPERIKETWDRLTVEGFQIRYGEHYEARQAAWERFVYEKEMIEKMGFVPYFLVVADFIRYARQQGIPVGPGRGSVGGCAIAYCLRITDVDPLQYGLLFERFLNPDRISMPDIDIDFCKDRVSEILDYIVEKYGRDKVARISAYGKMWAKQALTDVGRMVNMPQDEIRAITAEIPDAQGEFRMTIEEAMEEVDELKVLAASKEERHVKLINLSRKLEGIKRVVTTHACGIVIGDEPLEKHMALQPVRGEPPGGLLQSQLDMDSLERLGLLKMDFLALDTLTIIARTEHWIHKRRGVSYIAGADMARLDPDAFKLIADGRTVGVFQIEKPGMRELAMLVQPKNLEDVAIILALYRPGPLDAKDEAGLTMVDYYVLRHAGKMAVSYEHPSIEATLKSTYGIMVYQEQIMQVARDLCGYSMSQADMLRKAVGKKKPELIKKERDRFVPMAIERGVPKEVVESIWSKIEKTARYSFNKSHAIGYAALTYQTAFLKAHFPTEYMAACLSAACGYSPHEFREDVAKKTKSDVKVRRLVDEATRLGLDLLAPNVNESLEECVPEGERTIRMGLCAVKGVGLNAGKILSAREASGGRFRTYQDFVTRCRLAKIDSGSLESLIKSGACDDLGERNKMLAALEGSIATVKETEKYGIGVPSFVALPEEMPNVPAMPEEQRQSLTLDLVGAYDVHGAAMTSIGILVIGSQNLLEIAKVASSKPGKTPLLVTWRKSVQDTGTLYIDMGLVSEEAVSSLQKHGTVGAH